MSYVPVGSTPSQKVEMQDPHYISSNTTVIEIQQPVETDQDSHITNQTEILQYLEPTSKSAHETAISEVTMVESVTQQKQDSQLSHEFADIKDTVDEKLKHDIRHIDTVGQILITILVAINFSTFSNVHRLRILRSWKKRKVST